jgi:hypothetical protein
MLGPDHESRNGIKQMHISDRSKALLLQQRAILEDNMKDLAYMELISGNSALQSKTHTRQGSNNVPKVNLSGLSTPTNELNPQFGQYKPSQ